MILTVVFVIVTVALMCVYIIKNNSMYNFLLELRGEISNNPDSMFLMNAKSTYHKYKSENPYTDLNIQSVVEELFSNLKFKDSSLLNQLKVIKSCSSQPILIGVLGTFVGLTIALVPLSQSSDQIIESMSTVLSGMNVAFISSIVGILCSFLLGFMLKTRNVENLMLQIMLKLENLLAAEASIEKGNLVRENMNEIKESIYSITDSIKSLERLDDAATKMKEFNNTFADTVHKLDNALDRSSGCLMTFMDNVVKLENQFYKIESRFTELFDYFETHNKIQTQIGEGINKSCEVISLTTINQKNMNTTLEDFIRDTNAANKIAYRNLNDYFEQSNYLVSDLTNYQKELHSSIKHLCTNVEIQSKNVNEQVSKIDTILGESIDKSLSKFDNYVQMTNEILDKKLDVILGYDRINKMLAYSSIDEVERKYD